MKNTLAENLIRFGGKNLTKSTRRKLAHLAEQEETQNTKRNIGNISISISQAGQFPPKKFNQIFWLPKQDNAAAVLFGRSAANNKVNIWGDGTQFSYDNPENGTAVYGKVLMAIGNPATSGYIAIGEKLGGTVANPTNKGKYIIRFNLYDLVGNGDINQTAAEVIGETPLPQGYSEAAKALVGLYSDINTVAGIWNYGGKGLAPILVKNGWIAAPTAEEKKLSHDISRLIKGK